MSVVTATLFIISAVAALLFVARRWWRLRKDFEGRGFAAFLSVWAYNALLAATVILFGLFVGVDVARFFGALGAAVVAVGLFVAAEVYNHRHNGSHSRSKG